MRNDLEDLVVRQSIDKIKELLSKNKDPEEINKALDKAISQVTNERPYDQKLLLITYMLIDAGAKLEPILKKYKLRLETDNIIHKKISEHLSNPNTLTHLAERGNLSEVKNILKSTKPPSNQDINNALIATITSFNDFDKNNRLAIIDLLGGHGEDLEQIKKLIDKLETNAKKGKPISIQPEAYNRIFKSLYGCAKAAALGNLEKVKEVVKYNKNSVNQLSINGNTPLMEAIRVGANYSHNKKGNLIGKKNENLEVIRFLIENGADINFLNKTESETALSLAVEGGHLDIVNLLIAKGAKFDTTHKDNLTPLMIAVKNNNLEAIKALIKNGAQINQTNIYGESALILAAEHNNTEIVKFLISNGATINTANSEGQTALMYAAKNGNLEMTKFILKNISQASELYNKNKNKETAYNIASKHKNKDIQKLITNKYSEIFIKRANELWGYYTKPLLAFTQSAKSKSDKTSSLSSSSDKERSSYASSKTSIDNYENLDEILKKMDNRVSTNQSQKNSLSKILASLKLPILKRKPKMTSLGRRSSKSSALL